MQNVIYQSLFLRYGRERNFEERRFKFDYTKFDIKFEGI